MIKWISKKLDTWAALRCPCCKRNKYKEDMFRLYVMHPLMGLQLHRYTETELYAFVRMLYVPSEYVATVTSVLLMRTQRGQTRLDEIKPSIDAGLRRYYDAMSVEVVHD